MTWSLLYSRRAVCDMVDAAGMRMAGESGAARTRWAMQCPSCGASLPAGARSCLNCGRVFLSAAPP